MPTEPIYFKTEQHSYLNQLVEEESNGIQNVSQAAQYCVNQQRQRDKTND